MTLAPVKFSMRTKASQTTARSIRPITAQVNIDQALATALGSDPAVVSRIPAMMMIPTATSANRAGRG
ncbi:MAG: hypothetical protein UW42_C0004G0034 [Candidatus Collierbacteria bacterium GW2011_GWB1_44_197]|nr:MAG: hypothetical protein UW42_C0004G0034 [Candidatus Collierbacteria bacterium GW2011_GWB1_44_197]KKT61851.1 MAG: hypothetical protein UW56_C0017G0034 [Candidatus Collierbacteria bacterium GW2011_GWD1_44_27]